jgi:hypothetical protein
VDWAYAIERHRQPLLRIVAALYAMIGLADGGTLERLSRPLYRAVLAVLRPAEAAVRRLIIVMAQGLEVEPQAAHKASKGPASSGKGKAKSRRRSFPLFDPRLRQAGFTGRRSTQDSRPEPRIHFFGSDPVSPLYRRSPPLAPPAPQPEPEPDDSVKALPLCRRLDAIMDALTDLPRQAKRYARWRAKPSEERRSQLVTPLRRGAPPGLREKSSHEVHAILKECHWLARTVAASDTS